MLLVKVSFTLTNLLFFYLSSLFPVSKEQNTQAAASEFLAGAGGRFHRLR